MRWTTIGFGFLVACGASPTAPTSPSANAGSNGNDLSTSWPKNAAPVVVASVVTPVVGPTAASVVVTQIAANDDTTCARLADATVRCWGDDQFDVVRLIAHGAMAEQAVPHPTAIAGLEPVTKVVVGPAHACVLLANGDVKCWGNDDGALGLGTPLPPGPPPTTPRPAPVLDLHGVLDLAGSRHLCAIVGDGSVSCWHDYDSGNGDPRDAGSRKPVLVPAFAHAAQLADGGTVSCARFADGKAKCFRDVSPGLIPRGKVRVDPIEVPQMGKVTSLAAGDSGVCGITNEKTVRCWGQVAFEHPSGSSWKTPAYAIAGLGDVVSLAVGRDSVCAIVGSGDVLCDQEDWSKPHKPTKVVGVSNAVEIVVGSDHACARTTAGAMFCWGRNDKGQLGDGTKIDRTEAVPVSF